MSRKTFEDLKEEYTNRNAEFYRKPSIAYIEPFSIFGNLHYVGDRRVCAHLIDTGDGLILIDAGFQHAIHLLIESIWEAGFNPKDIKYLILTHGHFDHFGASDEFRELFGCKVFMSRADCDILRNDPETGLLSMNPNPFAKLPTVDYEFEDGEIIKLGNTEIECIYSPGHTPGTTSFFFDVTDGETTYKAGLFGGVGFISLYKGFLENFGFDMSIRDEFSKTIEKLLPRKVDITLGNHPAQNKTIQKREQMLANPEENPFIDPDEWQSFLTDLKESYRKLLKEDA